MAPQSPTPERLHQLLQMCAHNETQVIKLLARSYGLTPEEIAPTVKGWLEDLPAAAPPSRQRSAPGALTGASSMAAPFPRVPDQRMPPNVLPIKPPPASAPTRPAAKEVMAAMRAIDTRLNGSTRADGRAPAAPKANRLALVPEHAPFQPLANMGSDNGPHDEPTDEDSMAKAYVQMQALVHGRGRIEPCTGGQRSAVASTWMTRAVKNRF